MIKDFAGKTAVVTGGASGIGLAITEACAERGMNVLIADIEKTVMDDVVARFKSQQGAKVEGVLVDVTDLANISEMYDAARDTFGNVHMLVNNAGVGGGGPIAETDLDTWKWTLDVNLNGVIYGIQKFLPHMLAHGEEGHIVNTASMAGMFSAPGMAPYNASKFGVVAITEALAGELVETPLGASALCPGFVRTRIHESRRNRQEKYGEQAGKVDPDMLAGLAAVIEEGMDPALVAQLVLRGVEDDRVHIFTHPEMREHLEMRLMMIRNNYDQNMEILEELEKAAG